MNPILDPRCWENDPELWRDRYPWPRNEGHKFMRGHALVLGGARLTGASRLTARAAQRIGAGLVTIAAPSEVWAIYATAMTSVMVAPIAGADEFSGLLADPRYNAIAIGPGAGLGENTRSCVLASLGSGRATVLDADALTSFQQDPQTLFQAISGQCVLTPHEGEFARVFKVAGDKLSRAREAARQSGAVVLLKGADTVIAAPDGRAVVNANAPAELATGGTGDVLTGFVVGLLAQGMTPFDAACAGAWLHGDAGSAVGPGLIAEDLIDTLPGVLKRFRFP